MISVNNLSYKKTYVEKLEDLPQYIRETRIGNKVKQNLKDYGIITIHDFIMEVGTSKIKIPGLSKATYERVLSCILEYLCIIYTNDKNDEEIAWSSSINDWVIRYQTHHTMISCITPERAIALLNATIDYMLVGEKPTNVIRQLLYVGFTKEELIKDSRFNEFDVNSVIKNKGNEEK